MEHTLEIELALETKERDFIHRYRLMKERLLNIEYEHWAAGFPEGNNHGRGHITRVLEYLNLLLGKPPLKYVNVYELFLTMMAILYHDIGLLWQRKDHADVSGVLLEGDTNDAYIVNPIDKKIILAAVVSHSSSKDIAKEVQHFSPVEIVGRHRARPAVVSALVRFADELDEDHRRADPILQRRLDLPEESRFFWLFCQRVRGIRPDIVSKRIDLNLALELDDTTTYGLVPGGKVRHFVAFVAEKLAKINEERVRVNRFLPSELQYAGLHVDVKPVPGHATWKVPRTFVFNDMTPAHMFLASFPELLAEPPRKKLQGILELMRKRKLDRADKELRALVLVMKDLPIEVQMQILYERACTESMKAADHAPDSPARSAALDAAVAHLIAWYVKGRDGGWEATGRTVTAEVHRMANDGDLKTVIDDRQKELKRTIPKSYWPKPGSSGAGGCVVVGTVIDAARGSRRVEELRLGDAVRSVRPDKNPKPIYNTVTGIVTSRVANCVQVNRKLRATSRQRIRSAAGWVRVGELEVGDKVMDRHGVLVQVESLDRMDGYFESFYMTIDGADHTYIADGLLCHNAKYK